MQKLKKKLIVMMNLKKTKEILKNYLKQIPVSTFPEFKNYGQDLYYKKK